MGTRGLSMSVMEAALVQLPPSIINSHTLPPMVDRAWKIYSLNRFKGNLFDMCNDVNLITFVNSLIILLKFN